jgi:RNA polymerase sigma-70 factor (ECF subfamily)
MRNIFINDYRRNGRKKLVMENIRYVEVANSFANGNSAILKEIQGAIYNLPTIFKTASLLYFQGYKYQEIAETLNEPLGTIKSRIHFARKLLQKQIER